VRQVHARFALQAGDCVDHVRAGELECRPQLLAREHLDRRARHFLANAKEERHEPQRDVPQPAVPEEQEPPPAHRPFARAIVRSNAVPTSDPKSSGQQT
jgi:hypothetical protein